MSASEVRSTSRRNPAVPSADRLFYASSVIANAETNLQPFFYACVANWDFLYTEVEKRTIISMLPVPYQHFDEDEEGRLKCPLKADFVSSDQTFRDGIARFQRDVADGYWTNTWRLNAIRASAERANGNFDDYLEQHAEELFGNGDHNLAVVPESDDDATFVSQIRGDARKRRDKIRKSDRSKKSERHLALSDRDNAPRGESD